MISRGAGLELTLGSRGREWRSFARWLECFFIWGLRSLLDCSKVDLRVEMLASLAVHDDVAVPFGLEVWVLTTGIGCLVDYACITESRYSHSGKTDGMKLHINVLIVL